jgi:hypothetical protein
MTGIPAGKYCTYQVKIREMVRGKERKGERGIRRRRVCERIQG